MININQIGYELKEKKFFLVNSPEKKIKSFKLNNSENNTVYSGELSGPLKDLDSGDVLYKGDFTEFKESGQYYIEIPGQEKSYKFEIKKKVYSDLKDALLKALYFQRCGIKLEEKFASCWKHDKCHLNDAYLYEEPDLQIDTRGGWHDAGDYGKYVVPAGKTVADLLLSYEFIPEAFTDNLNIPESGNGIPDILDEAKFALDWMLKMQSVNGGVYHKVTTKNFIGMEMPETSEEKRYIFPISSTATAVFTAVMSMASRMYKSFDKGFSKKALVSAEKAWEWLERNPEFEEYKNPSGVNTGVYGDDDDRDERFWAAAELYRSTNKDKYHQYLKLNYKNNFSKTAIDWKHVGGYGTISYLFLDKKKRDKKVYKDLRGEFLNDVNHLVKRAKNSGYGISLAKYIWGSNGVIMDQSLKLILASFLNHEEKERYINVARNNFNYLLGSNSLGQCFLTGFGTKSIIYPHHRPSSADGIEEPVPGLVSGGPNQNLQDKILRKSVSADVPPARAFVDAEGSHSANEITTYWNSPAVFVAGYFSIR